MKKETKRKIDQLCKNILLFSNKYIDENKSSYRKVNRRKFYEIFIKSYPLQYQRNDDVYLQFGVFYKKVKEIEICSNWKLNKNKNKIFKLSKRKIKDKINTYANW